MFVVPKVGGTSSKDVQRRVGEHHNWYYSSHSDPDAQISVQRLSIRLMWLLEPQVFRISFTHTRIHRQCAMSNCKKTPTRNRTAQTALIRELNSHMRTSCHPSFPSRNPGSRRAELTSCINILLFRDKSCARNRYRFAHAVENDGKLANRSRGHARLHMI